MRKILNSSVIAVTIAVLAFSWIGSRIPVANAAVSAWQQGATIVPKYTTDFSSANFKQSVTNLKATGADYVTLIIPYYQNSQSDLYMGPGGDTPTDASLRDAINYAHSIGMKVMIKPHLEAYGVSWRANISANDRPTWYANYGATPNRCAITA